MDLQIILLSVVGLLLGLYIQTIPTQRSQSKEIQSLRKTIQDQQRLLMSRDPMTYSTLASVSNYSESVIPEPVPMDDASELERYLTSRGLGEVIVDDDSNGGESDAAGISYSDLK